MSYTFPIWHLLRRWAFSVRIAGFTGLGLSCLMSPTASAVTSGSLALARTFDKTVAMVNSPIVVTATLTNPGPDTWRGFYYFDEVPTGLTVTTVSVTLNGVGLATFSSESGLDGDVSAGYTPRRWWLETPTNFVEANPLPPQAVVQIVFSISCANTGTFALQDFGCAACKPDKTNTLYGYSGPIDLQTVSFVPGDGPVITTSPVSQSAAAGANVNFSVAASATQPLSYQWWFNGTTLAGAANTNLALSNVQPANAGSYSVVVTNVAGMATSAVATLSVTVPGSCVLAPAGIVGWWPGDGNPNDIASTNNGTLQGGATATVAGEVGQAFNFDGINSFVQIPDAAALRPANLTIEAWVRFASLDSTGSGGSPAGDQYIVFKQNTSSGDFEGFDLSKTRVAGGDVFRFLVSSATAQLAEIHSATLVTTGVWYHVAAVRGSNFTQLYVNGRLESQTSVAFAQNYGSLPLYFGTSGQAYWDHKLKGSLDEVSLYNRALSSNEVAAVYAAGTAGKCKAGGGLSIAAQPQNQTVPVRGAALFTVTATGTAPLSYQWRFNGTALTGATNTNLALSNVQPANAGSYSVVVTNSAASVTSAAAVLTVLVPPAFTAQPQSLTNVAGTTASFSAAATGSAPMNYQWRLNGAGLTNSSRISGVTTGTLTITNVQSLDAGSYTLVVTNGAGAAISAVATLTVNGPPVITTPPASQASVAGASVNFSVAASGTQPLGYQWRFNGTNLSDGAQISGSAGATLTVSSVQPANAGSYSVVVTNVAGAATSAVAGLTVQVPPAITVQPQSRTNIASATATFSAAASGSAPLSYQWQQNGVNLSNAGRVSGATGTTLTITNVQLADAGAYTLAASNAVGVAASTPAIQTVIAPPVITGQPASQSVGVGTNVSFSVTLSGTSPLIYQWRFNGTNLADGGQFLGTGGPVLSLGNAQTTNAGSYLVVVTNVAGATTSAVAGLAVIVPGSCLPAAAGLIGWWPADGNANDIVGTNNGTLQSGATATAVGEVGQAFSFNGTNNYVSIPNSTTLRPTNFTIETWVQFSSLNSAGSGSSPAGDQYIVFKQNTRGGDFEGFDLSKTRVAGGDVFRFLVASATAQTAEIDSVTLLSTGVWYHVAAVRGSNFTQLYVNGRLERQMTVSFPQDYGALPLYFGTSGQAYWDHKLKGALDEISLYNRALSSNEVAAIYAAGAAGKCKMVNGAAAPNLTLAKAQTADAGNYAVIVTNSAASVTSAVAVSTGPLVISQPQPTVVAPHFLAPFAQNGNIFLTLVGESGRACRIEASSDLENWFEVRTVRLLDSTAMISEPMTAGPHFYRATLLP